MRLHIIASVHFCCIGWQTQHQQCSSHHSRKETGHPRVGDSLVFIKGRYAGGIVSLTKTSVKTVRPLGEVWKALQHKPTRWSLHFGPPMPSASRAQSTPVPTFLQQQHLSASWHLYSCTAGQLSQLCKPRRGSAKLLVRQIQTQQCQQVVCTSLPVSQVEQRRAKLLVRQCQKKRCRQQQCQQVANASLPVSQVEREI